MHIPHVDDLIDAYVLGALEPEEVDQVEQHIETCEACRALLTAARATADELLIATPQVAMPPTLRGRVLARIHAEAQDNNATSSQAAADTPQATVPATPASRSSTFSRLLHALFGEQSDQQAASGDLLRELLSEPECLIWDVPGTADAPQANARLVGAPSRRDAVLVTNGLPPAGTGKAYQVWFLSGDNKPLPNALFTVDRRGHGSRILHTSAPLLDFDTIAITPEPEGGSPGPTGPIVLAGSLATE